MTAIFLRDITNDKENVQYERKFSQLGGGPALDVPYAPYDINKVYNQWYDLIHSNDSLNVPQKMTFRPWYEIAEVKEIVDTLSADLKTLFTRDPPQWWFINRF